MDIISCPGPEWPEWPDDQYIASRCVTKRLLHLLVPAAMCLLSLAIVGIGNYHDARRRCRKISLESEPTSRRLPYHVSDPRPRTRVKISRTMQSLKIAILAIITSTDALHLVYHAQYGSAMSLSASAYLLALALAQCFGHGAPNTRWRWRESTLRGSEAMSSSSSCPVQFS